MFTHTFLGDGIFALCLIAFYFFRLKNKQYAKALLLTFLCSGIITQVIKNMVYAPRPKLFFEPGQYLFFIDGVTLSNHHAFPSGHTATAFAIATMLVLLANTKKRPLLFFFAAALVGYSRIYLAQHFLEDILAGALIGVASSVTVYVLLQYGIKWKWGRKWELRPGAKGSIAYP